MAAPSFRSPPSHQGSHHEGFIRLGVFSVQDLVQDSHMEGTVKCLHTKNALKALPNSLALKIVKIGVPASGARSGEVRIEAFRV